MECYLPSESLPPQFYESMPADAPAIFSTRGCSRQPRACPFPRPSRTVRSGQDSLLDDEILDRANALRHEFRDISDKLMPPARWSDLYQYFDGYDIYVQNPGFLFLVISLIGRQNLDKIQLIQDAMLQWVETNWIRFIQFPAGADIVSMATTPEDQDFFCYTHMTEYEYQVLGEMLRRHRLIVEPQLLAKQAQIQEQQQELRLCEAKAATERQATEYARRDQSRIGHFRACGSNGESYLLIYFPVGARRRSCTSPTSRPGTAIYHQEAN